MVPTIHGNVFGGAKVGRTSPRMRYGNGFRAPGQHAPRQLAAAEWQSPCREQGVARGPGKQRADAAPHDDTVRRTPDRRETFHARRPYRGRLTGPVMFVIGLLESWKLDRSAAVFLLGFEQPDSAVVERILSGSAPLVGRDAEDRIAYLYRIRSTLSALFRNEDVENEWLREPRALLGERTPMELLREGSMENLLLVKEYVEEIAGR